jgi:hypothetical protein
LRYSQFALATIPQTACGGPTAANSERGDFESSTGQTACDSYERIFAVPAAGVAQMGDYRIYIIGSDGHFQKATDHANERPREVRSGRKDVSEVSVFFGW